MKTKMLEATATCDLITLHVAFGQEQTPSAVPLLPRGFAFRERLVLEQH